MKFRFYLAMLMMVLPSGLWAQDWATSKCEANINGFKIHNVYIMGGQFNAVVWGYKHLSEATCLTPVTDLSKADAILELIPIMTGEVSTRDNPISVSCTSNRNSSTCTDSSGGMMTVNCTGSNCTSYYGPDPTKAVAQGLLNWINSGWSTATARLYTVDHKLLWRSTDTKRDWLGAMWPDLVRLGTNSPVCKVGAFQRSSFKSFRHWASTKCGVEFEPEVSIDLKLLAKQEAVQARQSEKDEMIRNAKEAAAKQ